MLASITGPATGASSIGVPITVITRPIRYRPRDLSRERLPDGQGHPGAQARDDPEGEWPRSTWRDYPLDATPTLWP
jgi:hypothetical protein